MINLLQKITNFNQKVLYDTTEDNFPKNEEGKNFATHPETEADIHFSLLTYWEI